MSEAVIAAAQPLNALERWLRFDRSIDVEWAYKRFVRSAMFGWALMAGFIVAVVLAVVFTALVPSRNAANFTFETLLVLYTVPLLALRGMKREVLAKMLRGRIDLGRGLLFGSAVGLLLVLLQLAAILLMDRAGVKMPAPQPLFGGISGAFIFLVLLAPVVEEFALQGWLQTRLLRWGIPFSVIATTAIFVLLHAPSNPYEFIRAGGLLILALLRVWTGSLGACMAMHGTNNLVSFGFIFLDTLQTQGVHK